MNINIKVNKDFERALQGVVSKYGEDFETLNGFLISKLEHIPASDEKATINYCGYAFDIVAMGDNIIDMVRVSKAKNKSLQES